MTPYKTIKISGEAMNFIGCRLTGAIHRIAEKDCLDMGDIQAIRTLLDIQEYLRSTSGDSLHLQNLEMQDMSLKKIARDDGNREKNIRCDENYVSLDNFSKNL